MDKTSDNSVQDEGENLKRREIKKRRSLRTKTLSKTKIAIIFEKMAAALGLIIRYDSFWPVGVSRA